MPELDPFEARLTSAVRGFADLAATDVDAGAVAEQAIGGRRPRVISWLSYPLPVPVTILLLLALLVLALSWTLVGGGHRDDRSAVVLPPGPTASGPVVRSAPTPIPTTDGQGAESVLMLTSTPVVLVERGLETPVGDLLRIRGRVVRLESVMNDARVSGTVVLSFDADVHGASNGPAWGRLTMTRPSSTWSGPCTGGTYADPPGGPAPSAWAAASYGWSCWLAGGGDLAGMTYYLQLGWRGSDVTSGQGIIYPGTIPPSSPAP